MDVHGKRLETAGVYLGARLPNESKWRYIDATLTDRNQVKKMFPDLPDDVDLAVELPRHVE